MEAFGIKRVGRYSLRMFLARALTVEWAARAHRVPLDEFLEILNKAIAKKEENDIYCHYYIGFQRAITLLYGSKRASVIPAENLLNQSFIEAQRRYLHSETCPMPYPFSNTR